MIVYSKEYIADTKVMRRNVYNDGTVKIEFVRNIDFKDTKKFPNLKLETSVIEEKPVETIKSNTLEDIKTIVDTLGEVEKIEDKRRSSRKKKNEELILPKPEDLIE